MESVVWVFHVLAASAVIGLVLLQHGKGADMGAAFGSGASGSLFGVSGSANLLSRATAWSVALFFVTSLTLAYMSGHRAKHSSVMDFQQKQTQQKSAAPDVPKPAALPNAKDVPQ
jgi:preprotein translocase subunit SecG